MSDLIEARQQLEQAADDLLGASNPNNNGLTPVSEAIDYTNDMLLQIPDTNGHGLESAVIDVSNTVTPPGLSGGSLARIAIRRATTPEGESEISIDLTSTNKTHEHYRFNGRRDTVSYTGVSLNGFASEPERDISALNTDGTYALNQIIRGVLDRPELFSRKNGQSPQEVQ